MPKKVKKFIGVVVIALPIIIGVLIWQRPGRAVNQAISGLANAQSQQFDATVTIANAQATQDLIGEQAQVQLEIAGTFQRNDQQRDDIDADLAIITQTEGLTLRIEALTRFIGDKAYLQITKTPATFPALVQLKDTWIELPRGGAETEDVNITNEQLLTDIRRGDKVEVDGQSLRSYQATATSAAIVAMLDATADILGTRLTEQQVADLRASMTQVQEVPVELAIRPWTNKLRQIKATITVPGSNTLGITLQFADAAEDKAIIAPDQFVTIEEALSATP